MHESSSERLRREVREFIDAGQPYQPYGDGPSEVIQWLAWRPVKVREAIFLILDGHDAQDHRAHLKGAETARARRKISA